MPTRTTSRSPPSARETTPEEHARQAALGPALERCDKHATAEVGRALLAEERWAYDLFVRALDPLAPWAIQLAFTTLYAEVYRVCRGKVDDDAMAQDIASDLCLLVVSTRFETNDPGHLIGYLRLSALRRVRRTRKKQTQHGEFDEATAVPAPGRWPVAPPPLDPFRAVAIKEQIEKMKRVVDSDRWAELWDNKVEGKTLKDLGSARGVKGQSIHARIRATVAAGIAAADGAPRRAAKPRRKKGKR